ncbi:hypothetical protein J5N97_002373 [Dioscorea zingiberensis]|uniref:PUM-HD domain-containing protein n=1 Tax=Dioscorea zingiberensis TaxID=325984 RepID=A0A9D5HQC3_9LILI|nr:hypothetical protein J5N97_002373 [Dioscorea zingiberensis]
MSMRPDSGKGLGDEESRLLLREQRWGNAAPSDRDWELGLQRSGSAPPSVGESREAIARFKDGDRLSSSSVLQSDPAYLSSCYSHSNRNPRVPSPALSWENRSLSQGFQGFGGIGDQRKSSRAEEEAGLSLFSRQPSFGALEERQVGQGNAFSSPGWLDQEGDGLIGFSGLELGRQGSFTDVYQDELGQGTLLAAPSHPESYSPFGSAMEPSNITDEATSSVSGLQSGGSAQIGANFQQRRLSSTASHRDSVLGSPLARNPTPYSLMASRNSLSDDLVPALSGMNLLTDNTYDDTSELHNNIDNMRLGMSTYLQSVRSQRPDFSGSTGVDFSNLTMRPDSQVDLHRRRVPCPVDVQIPSATSVASHRVSPLQFQNPDDSNVAIANFGLSNYNANHALAARPRNIWTSNLPHLFENSAASDASLSSLSHGLGTLESGALGAVFPSGRDFNDADLQNVDDLGNYAAAAATPVQMPQHADPRHLEYLRVADWAAHIAAATGDPSIAKPYLDILGIQKAYLGALVQPDKQNVIPSQARAAGMNPNYLANPPLKLGLPYPLAIPAQPVPPARPLRHGSGLSNVSGSAVGSWHADSMGTIDETLPQSLLEEFKSNKTRSLELYEITGHVVGFSTDQYGSRFIQQKLETAKEEETNMVFQEIIPQALSLMTDVFGNYVIQKFFEHGTVSQVRELGDILSGHVLKLSLQMYGCRVIQKAIEFVDLDQRTRMVQELDGHIMRCVLDQNGNHVIQKCIECIPQDSLQFILSEFVGQVVTLSTHPYGCRVVQRVLEHCYDPKTQTIVMDEILRNVIRLSKDQYGNYVIQHVLEHGKPEERSAIISYLTGQIVELSLQKFASNVVEKCLIYADLEERQALVNEILGTTDENEPLQVMMKDQYGNYVVQKVLQTVDNQQCELILSRIKVHLNSLKKYTYGKHIVTRVEKLVAAGGKDEVRGDQWTMPTSPHNHHGKKSIMVKVKDKALKWRHMLGKKHGHHKSGEEATPIPFGVHEDNNGGEEDPEFHGAPMYESERSPRFYKERSSRRPPIKPNMELEMKYMFDSHKKRGSQLHHLNAFRETSMEKNTTLKEMVLKVIAPAWTKAMEIKQGISYDKCVSLMVIVMHKLEPGEDDRALCEVLTETALLYNGVPEIDGVVNKVKNTLFSLLGLTKEQSIKEQSETLIPTSTNPHTVTWIDGK